MMTKMLLLQKREAMREILRTRIQYWDKLRDLEVLLGKDIDDEETLGAIDDATADVCGELEILDETLDELLALCEKNGVPNEMHDNG